MYQDIYRHRLPFARIILGNGKVNEKKILSSYPFFIHLIFAWEQRNVAVDVLSTDRRQGEPFPRRPSSPRGRSPSPLGRITSSICTQNAKWNTEKPQQPRALQVIMAIRDTSPPWVLPRQRQQRQQKRPSSPPPRYGENTRNGSPCSGPLPGTEGRTQQRARHRHGSVGAVHKGNTSGTCMWSGMLAWSATNMVTVFSVMLSDVF